MTDLSALNKQMFEDVNCCKCGCHSGVYVMKDGDGFWYVCNDCDLPVYGSYRPFEYSAPRHRDEEYED